MIRIHILCTSPLVHGAFDAGDIGNATAIRRLPIVSLPGRPAVPCLSGNALRGRIRRVLMRGLFDACGLSREDLPAPVWDRLYAALANGGHLDGSEQTTRPEERRALRAALPPLSVLGSALYTWMLEGRMSVGICWPVCAETGEAGLVSVDDAPLMAEDLVHEMSHVRHIERSEHDPADSGVTPMPTTMETLATGTRLQSVIRFAPEATALERSAVAWALDHIHDLGGKSAGGLGQTTITHDGNAALYSAWLAEPQAARAALIELAEKLSGHKAIVKRGRPRKDAA